MQGSCFGATRGCNMRSKRGVWFDLSRVRGEIGLSVRCYSASQLPRRRVSSLPALSFQSTVLLFSACSLLTSSIPPHISLIGLFDDVAMCQLVSSPILFNSGKAVNSCVCLSNAKVDVCMSVCELTVKKRSWFYRKQTSCLFLFVCLFVWADSPLLKVTAHSSTQCTQQQTTTNQKNVCFKFCAGASYFSRINK